MKWWVVWVSEVVVVVVVCTQVISGGGIPALYAGLPATLFGVLPFAALKLGIYDSLKVSDNQMAKVGSETMWDQVI